MEAMRIVFASSALLMGLALVGCNDQTGGGGGGANHSACGAGRQELVVSVGGRPASRDGVTATLTGHIGPPQRRVRLRVRTTTKKISAFMVLTENTQRVHGGTRVVRHSHPGGFLVKAHSSLNRIYATNDFTYPARTGAITGFRLCYKA